MPEIEFVEVYQPAEDSPAGDARRFDPRMVLALVPGVVATAAAGLAAWAPFRWLFTVSEPSQNLFTSTTPAGNALTSTQIHADAWGRTIGLPPGANAGTHGVRLGIVFVVCGAICLLAAAALLVAALARTGRLRRLGLWTGRLLCVAGAAGVTAMGATAYLSYLQVHDEFAQLSSTNGDPANGVTLTQHIDGGDCWIFAALAGLAALIAAGLSFPLARLAPERADLRPIDSQPSPNFGG